MRRVFRKEIKDEEKNKDKYESLLNASKDRFGEGNTDCFVKIEARPLSRRDD